jgi:hypothetical protein
VFRGQGTYFEISRKSCRAKKVLCPRNSLKYGLFPDSPVLHVIASVAFFDWSQNLISSFVAIGILQVPLKG